MTVAFIFDLGWNRDEAAVTYPTLGDDALSEALPLDCLTLQHGNLHAGIVVKGNADRCYRKVMLLLVGMGQALRKFASILVVKSQARRRS